MRQRARRGGLAAAAIVVAVSAWAPATAQPGYPGTTTTRPPQPTEETRGGGRIQDGESAEFESCGYSPATTATISWNGEPAGARTADGSGCVTVAVAVHCPAAEVNGTQHAARRGRNDLEVAGTGSNGAPRLVRWHITVSCSPGGGPREERPRAGGPPEGGGGQAEEIDFTQAASRSSRWRAPAAAAVAMVAAIGLGSAALTRRSRRRML